MGQLNTVGMKRTHCAVMEQIPLEDSGCMYDRSGSLPVSLIGILLVLFFLLRAIAYVSTPQRDVAQCPLGDPASARRPPLRLIDLALLAPGRHYWSQRVNELQSEPEIEPADDEALDPALELLPAEDHALKLAFRSQDHSSIMSCFVDLTVCNVLCDTDLLGQTHGCSIVFVSSGARPGRGTLLMRRCARVR